MKDWVIDCDTHITEPPDVWTARLPAKFRDRAPKIERVLPAPGLCLLFLRGVCATTLLDRIGADKILFETDYPHPVCLYGNVREKIDAGLAGQPPAVRCKLLWENAAKLYRVSAPDRPVPAI